MPYKTGPWGIQAKLRYEKRKAQRPLPRFPIDDRFGNKNPMWGRKMSELTKERIRKTKVGKLNPMWQGNAVGYGALHAWVKRRLSKPEFCSKCKSTSPCDLANISQRYERNLSDWEWLCRRCHMMKDGRMKNFIESNRGRGNVMQDLP